MSSVTQTRSSAGARRTTAARLAQSGRLAESLPLWHEELCSGDEGVAWVRAAAVEAMAWDDLRVAGVLARLYAAATWGSAWYPGPAAAIPVPARPPRIHLSVDKLRHDIDQFSHLRGRAALGAEFDEIIEAYGEIAGRLQARGSDARVPLDGEHAARIGHVYNRIVHLVDTPRVERALSPSWDPGAVEDRYLSEPPGVVVIDDFLSPAALEAVRRFCLDSTVWSGTRYTEGRLGAFFIDGFAAPVLLQISEELRGAFRRVIGDQHPLRQLWGFKSAPTAANAATTHADFAAVNVNFWITPTSSNLDPNSGGLVVYDVAAPLSWDFNTYNERPELIVGYLRDQGARAIRIPYRENRAIVFNSDLFHATEPIRFGPGYADRRINVTMLYGDRVEDRHHPSPTADVPATQTPAWRSGALRSARR